MALISQLLQLVNGVNRQVDLSVNTLVVQALKTGTNTLTDTILGRLISLQNGTDVDATYHTHDGRYYTKAQINSATSSSGSDLVGDDNTYSNFTPAAATVKGALSGIDAALATTTGATRALDNLLSVAINQSLTPGVTDDIDLGSPSKVWASLYAHLIKDASGIAAEDIFLRQLIDSAPALSLDWENRKLADSSEADSADWQARQLKSGATVKLDWSGTDVSLNTRKLTNVSDPSSAQDAATKSYVDAVADGRSWKQAVRAASVANLNLASMPAAVDGVTLSSGNRFLAKDQTDPTQNGIYIFNGASSAATRSSDADTAAELNGAALSALAEGTVNKNTQWYQSATVATVGSDPVTWVYLGSNNIFGHDMITVVGTQISVDLAAVSGLESSDPGQADGQLRVKLEASNPSLRITGSNELAAKLNAAGAIVSGASGLSVQVDNSTIEINTNALRVKDAGITLAKLASNSVDENKIVSSALSASGALTGGSGSKLAWNPDNSTLEINSNAARIKDDGVTAAKLNTNAFDQDTITGGGGSAAQVQSSPTLKREVVAGDTFSNDTSFLVRWAIFGETAGRVYLAQIDASVADNFYVVGFVKPPTTPAAPGDSVVLYTSGLYTLASGDTPFASTDVGRPVFLDANGAFTMTAPTAPDMAVVRVGIVKDVTEIDLQMQVMGIN